MNVLLKEYTDGECEVTTRKIILTFHGVGESPEQIPSDERSVWVSEKKFCSILDVCAQAKSDGVDVEVMFDDGNLSDIDIALPALRQRGLQASFFIVAGRFGADGYLDAEDLRTLCREGMMVGCHGMKHVPWSGLTAAQLQEEIVDARHMIEHVLSDTVTLAAFPFGEYNRRVVRALKKAGYSHIYTSDRGWACSNALIQARNTVHGYDDIHDVSMWLYHPPNTIGKSVASLRRTIKRWR